MNSYEWSPPHVAVVYIGLILGLVTLLLLARRFAKSSTARSWPLLIVRAGVLAILVVLLLNPVRVNESRLPPRPAEMIYLVDSSLSMALDRPTSRLDQVKQAISKSKRLLPADGPTRVSLFRFGEDLLAVSRLDEVQAEDDATRLRAALESLPSRFGEDSPTGVVIFSDGRATETTGFDEVAAGYHRLGVPLHVFPVGDAREFRDVAIQDVIAPRDAVPGSRLPVRVLLRSHGYQGKRAEIRIRSTSHPALKPLATLPVTLTDGQQAHDLLIEYEPAAGKLAVEVPPLEGEALVENNFVPLHIGARKSKIRVIYMEGTTGGEYRFIHDALVEDPNIECVSMEVNNQYVFKPTLHRADDPNRGFPTTREELFTYDVVICSDINRTAFTQEQLDWTVELVGKRGGGFAMIGGNTSFGAGNWDQTVWNELIPVDMSGLANAAGRGTCWGVTFKVKVPREVERHPIWRIVDDPVKNRDILERMPPFFGTNLVERLKPAATALGFSDQPLANVGVMPIFSAEPFGKGRTFAMSTDSTVDWGRSFERDWGEDGDNRYFRKFWRNVILWMAENSPGANRRLRVETDKMVYRPGQPIKISAHAYDNKLEETTRYRLVARLLPGEPILPTRSAIPAPILQEAALTARSAEKPYEGELATPPLRLMPAPAHAAASPMRVMTLEVTAYDGDQVISQSALDAQILDDPVEYQDPRPDPNRLEEIARLSGGKVLHSAEELAQLVGSYTSMPGETVTQRSPLWDHWLLWTALILLLSVEWLLRRWWGLA